MFPHPDTICVLSTMEHRLALAGAARARRSGEAVTRSAGPELLGMARERLAAVRVGLARRLQGAPGSVPADPIVPAVPVRG